MTKERMAQLLTVLVMLAALGVAAYRKGAFSSLNASQLTQRAAAKADPTPQDVIYAMLDAARDGKVNDYLAAHTGQMEQALRKAVAEQSEAAFERRKGEAKKDI